MPSSIFLFELLFNFPFGPSSKLSSRFTFSHITLSRNNLPTLTLFVISWAGLFVNVHYQLGRFRSAMSLLLGDLFLPSPKTTRFDHKQSLPLAVAVSNMAAPQRPCRFALLCCLVQFALASTVLSAVRHRTTFLLTFTRWLALPCTWVSADYPSTRTIAPLSLLHPLDCVGLPGSCCCCYALSTSALCLLSPAMMWKLIQDPKSSLPVL